MKPATISLPSSSPLTTFSAFWIWPVHDEHGYSPFPPQEVDLSSFKVVYEVPAYRASSSLLAYKV